MPLIHVQLLRKPLACMAAIFAAGWIAGCAQPWTPVGSDRDANGCRPSAGYAWCTQLQSCQRPWELAREQNFVNTAAAFDAYCKNPVKSTGKPPG